MSIKSLSAILALSLAAATFAHADSITGSIGMGGNGTYNATSGVFTAGSDMPGTSSNAYVNAADFKTADSLSNFTMFNTGTLSTFNTNNLGSGVNVFTTSENGQTLSFELTSVTSSGSDSAGPGFVGTGILSETGYDSTAANFSLNTNTDAGTVITFNTVAAATPEPSSLFLLGTGALSAAGMLRRKVLQAKA